MNTLSLVIVTYNGEEFMQPLFDSLKKQDRIPDEVIVIDNSTDGGVTAKAAQAAYPQARILPQKENLDFSRGYNAGIAASTGDYVLIMNQDMTLAPNAISHLLHRMESDSTLGALAPKLRRIRDGVAESTILDGMGIVGTHSRRFRNIGEGEEDTGQYDEARIFGLSGAAMFFRKEALSDIAAHGGGGEHEYFDADFIAYKEDIDMSYRLRHRGWNLGVEPQAIIYHKRTAQELKDSEGLRADRKAKSFRIRGNSWRNHQWTIIKNEPLVNILLHGPWIACYEAAKFLYVLLFETSTAKIYPSFLQGIPRMLRKRRAILSSSKISARDLRKWFST